MQAVGLSPGAAAWRWGVITALAFVALLAIERWQIDPAGLAPGTEGPVALTGVARDYAEALARTDLVVANAKAQAEAGRDQWLLHETLARNYLVRARLTGSFEDYAAADAALDHAFAVARPGTGPHLVRALVDFGMHRLGAAERQFELIDAYAIPPDSGERAEIAAMRGDIAFYRGDYAAALAAYDEADRLVPGMSDFRRAVYYGRMGRPDRAEGYYNKAERALPFATPQVRARMELQRGILYLERGRWDEALARFRRADAMFPGYWLIEEHIAEVTALKGDLDGAERLYRDIVRRTGHPEFMDALAAIAAERGDRAQEAAWLRRADQVWRNRLRQFPEAAYGHAIDHCVQKEDWPCALALARRNHGARPYGDAKIALARALLHNGRAEEAQATIEAVLASPWRVPEAHAVAAEIYAATGASGESGRQRRLALAMDPHALDGLRLPAAGASD